MIWIGLIIGLALGGAIGVVIMALIRALGDDGKHYESEFWGDEDFVDE